jgi:hypothetical protein
VAVIGDVQEVLGAGAVQRERDAGRTGAARVLEEFVMLFGIRGLA